MDAIRLANPYLDPERLPLGRALTIPLPFSVTPTDIPYSSALVGYIVRGLAARYPMLAVGEFGRSVLGRPLWYLTLGSGPKLVFYNAAHHANEWITTPLLLTFCEQLCARLGDGGDLAGQNIRDYLSAIDDVAGEPWADETRMGCVGASYGGYSVFFLAGCHEKRFKAFIAHCGIFNFESMYGETEELFFINNDYGGPYRDRSNQVAQRSYANSPHKFVGKWDTPILIFTGEYDFRIPYTQSLEAFTAARVRGIPARLVEFENDAHQVFRPQNSLVWNREFFGWLDKYVK